MIQRAYLKLRQAHSRERWAMIGSYVRGRIFSLRHNIKHTVFVRGRINLEIHNGTVELADYVKLYPNVRLVCQGSGEKALLKIGQSTSIGDRTEIHAGKKIVIGQRVMISWDCVILDRDYHGIDGRAEEFKPVVIEDDALICCRAMILKGVTIGRHAIVGAGAVVTKDVPAYGIVAGNPARVVRTREYEVANH